MSVLTLFKYLIKGILISAVLSFGILAQEQYAYVANSNSGTISVVDLNNFSTQTFNIGQSPYYIKKAPGADQLWITDPSYSQLKAINSSTGALLYSENLSYCKELIISPDGLLVYVAYLDYPVQIKVYNTADLSVAYNYSLSSVNYLDDIAISPDGDALYVLYDNYFYTINPLNGTVTNTIFLSEYAERILISRDGRFAYIYGDYYTIQKIDLQTSAISSQYIGDEIYSLAISPDGQTLYAGFYYSSNVILYNANTLNQLSTFSVSTSRVMDLQVSSDGSNLYVLHRDSPNFQVYDIQNGTQLSSVSTGSYSYRFDFDFQHPDSIPPQPITSLQAPEIYHDGVLLTWTAASDDSLEEPVRGYEVRYDTVAITNIDSAKVYEHSLKPSGPGETDSLLLTGFAAETDYWIAVRAYDEARNFSEPAFLEFSTLMPPTIAVSPATMEFTVSIGDTVTETITISNSAGSTAGLLSYSIDVIGEEGIEQFAYVANESNGTISVIDLLAETLETYYVGNAPYEIAPCPLTNELWIADIDYDIVKVVDAVTGTQTLQLNMYDLRKVLISPDGALAYVVYSDYPVQVAVYNTETHTEVDNFSISGSTNSNDASLSPDGQFLYMLYDDDFFVVDVSTGSVVNTIYLYEYVYRIALSPDGMFAYLYGNYYYVIKVDLQAYSHTSYNLSNEINSLALSPDGQKLYAGYYSGTNVAVYNSQNLNLLSYIVTGSSSTITDLRTSSDGNLLYLLHYYDSPNFEIIDLRDGSQKAAFSTGFYSYRFALSGSAFPFVELNPEAGKVPGGESVDISLIMDTKNLSHRTYHGNLVVESNDPGNPTLSLPLTINAMDTKGPDFNMAFFINPYLTGYLRTMVFAHEPLPQMPELVAGDTVSVPLAIQDSVYHIYMGKHKLTESGELRFAVSGADSLGNSASFEKILNVQQVLFAKPALAAYGNGEISVSFPARSFNKDLFVIVWEEETKVAGKDISRKIYHIGPEQMALNEPATLEIAYQELPVVGFDPLHFSIYLQNSEGEWEELPGQVNTEKKIISSKIDRLGIYKVGYDPATSSEEITSAPKEFSLKQNYPNPFNPSTTIYYALPHSEKVSLKVYDVLGREVKTLVDKPQEAGEYWVNFDARNFASGIYFYRLDAGHFTQTRKMVILK